MSLVAFSRLKLATTAGPAAKEAAGVATAAAEGATFRLEPHPSFSYERRERLHSLLKRIGLLELQPSLPIEPRTPYAMTISRPRALPRHADCHRTLMQGCVSSLCICSSQSYRAIQVFVHSAYHHGGEA